MKASDIPDHEPLKVVAATCDYGREYWSRSELWHPNPRNLGAMRHELEEELWEYPPKVIRAKCKALIRRGLLKGCICGCRGDFTITDDGRQLLATLN